MGASASALLAEGEPSAGSLLLTVLGEFVLPTGDAVWTSTLTDALASLDVEEKATRQALARHTRRGLLEGEKVGRRARWRLTPAAVELLRQGTDRIYGFGCARPLWDERWLLVFCSVPDSRRDLRYRLRVRMGWAGLAAFGPGAWISPWAARQAEVVDALRELGLAGQGRCFTATLGQLGDARHIAAEAWALEELAGAYHRFIAAFRPDPAVEPFVALTALVHRWRRFPAVDPELPAALLPQPWPGPHAVALFQRRHAEWSPAARRRWRTAESA